MFAVIQFLYFIRCQKREYTCISIMLPLALSAHTTVGLWKTHIRQPLSIYNRLQHTCMYVHTMTLNIKIDWLQHGFRDMKSVFWSGPVIIVMPVIKTILPLVIQPLPYIFKVSYNRLYIHGSWYIFSLFTLKLHTVPEQLLVKYKFISKTLRHGANINSWRKDSSVWIYDKV